MNEKKLALIREMLKDMYVRWDDDVREGKRFLVIDGCDWVDLEVIEVLERAFRKQPHE
jgi:hypothetical protein